MNSGEVHERSASGQLVASAASLLTQNLTRLSDDDLVDQMREIETAKRILAAVEHRHLVEASDRHLWQHAGVKGPNQFLIETLRLSKADAAWRMRAVRELGVFHDMAGDDVEPQLPHTAAAQAAGEISPDHARAIMTVMRRIPRGVSREDCHNAEELLAQAAREVTPDAIKAIGAKILAYLDPDGTVTDDLDRQRMREFLLLRQRPDGMTEIKGCIDPVLRSVLDMILAKWARPGMCNPDDPESPGITAPSDTSGSGDAVDTPQLLICAERDGRSAGQRNHDALLAFLSAGGGPANLGVHRGLPVSVILTMKVSDLETATGVATTATGGTMSVTEAIALAQNSDATPYLAIFDPHGMPLHLAKPHRFANRWQRLALIAAERGCTRPGCDAPATMCAVHHVIDWSKGGPTAIENLTLACDACHSMINHTESSWATAKLDHRSKHPGHTGWKPPRHVDKYQHPRVNHRHHADRLLADILTRHQLEPVLTPRIGVRL